MAGSNYSKAASAVRTIHAFTLGVAFAAVAALGADLNLDDKEQLDVQNDLYWLTLTMWALVIGLLVFAYSIRYIAKRTTHPCHWCSEFISNKASICPRCGKQIESATKPA